MERQDTQKQIANSRLQHVQTAEKVGHLRAVCRNTNTHEIEKRMQMNQVQKSLSKQFGAWLFKTLSRMIIVITLRNTKEVQNIVMNQNWKSHHEHRDGSKIVEKSSRTSRRIKIVEKSLRTGQYSEKKSSRRSRWTSKTQAEDRVQDIKEFVQNELRDQKIGTRNTQRIRNELADVQKIEAWKIERIRDELVDGSKN